MTNSHKITGWTVLVLEPDFGHTWFMFSFLSDRSLFLNTIIKVTAGLCRPEQNMKSRACQVKEELWLNSQQITFTAQSKMVTWPQYGMTPTGLGWRVALLQAVRTVISRDFFFFFTLVKSEVEFSCSAPTTTSGWQQIMVMAAMVSIGRASVSLFSDGTPSQLRLNQAEPRRLI